LPTPLLCWVSQSEPQHAVPGQQAPLQLTVPDWQPCAQPPVEHTCPVGHVLLQEPQFAGFVWVLTQYRPHRVSPLAQVDEHAPLTQAWLSPQTFPHPPQLFGSVRVVTQTPAQYVVFAAHELTHCPPLHTVPAAHTAPQAPQFLGSLLVLTQLPLQVVVPDGQLLTQVPWWQTEPAAQVCPQLPQFLGSVVRVTQVPPHRTSPVGQVTAWGVHLPFEQVCPWGHL